MEIKIKEFFETAFADAHEVTATCSLAKEPCPYANDSELECKDCMIAVLNNKY